MITTRKPGMIQGLILIFPIVLTVMGAAMLAPVVPQIMAAFPDLENKEFLIPILLPLPALCIAFGGGFAGWLCDLFGRRKLLISAAVIYSIVGVAPAFLDSYWLIFTTRIGVGICEAVIIVASTAMIGDYFDGEERNRWLSSQAALASLSSIFLFPLAGFLGSQMGWRGPFWLYSAGMLMAVAIILLTWEVKRGNQQVKASAAQAETGSNWAANDGAMGKPLLVHFFKVCSMTLIGGIFYFIIILQLSTALSKFEIDNLMLTGVLLSLAHLGSPIGALSYRWLRPWLGFKKLLILVFAVTGVGFVLMAFAPTAKLFVLASFFNQLGAGLIVPSLITWAVAPLEYSNRGRGTGIFHSTYAFGQFASSISFVWVVSFFAEQDYMKSFMVFGVAAIALSFFILAVFKRDSERPELAVQPSSSR